MKRDPASGRPVTCIGAPSPRCGGEAPHGLRPTVVYEERGTAMTSANGERASTVWSKQVVCATASNPLPPGEGRRGAPSAEIQSWQNTQRSGGVRGRGTRTLADVNEKALTPHP